MSNQVRNRRKKTALFWASIILLVYGAIELLALFSLRQNSRIGHEFSPRDRLSNVQAEAINSYLIRGNLGYQKIDAELGWTVRPLAEIGPYRANSAGIRSDREYLIQSPSDVLRVVAFGDSFTFGDDVANISTWPAIMESSHTGPEVLNFGVSGYGLDQAYLRYLRSGKSYDSDIILIGFMSENFNRSVNTYRPFYRPSNFPFSKPRYILKNGELALISNRLKTPDDFSLLLEDPDTLLADMGVNDYFYQSGYGSGAYDWSPLVRASKVLSSILRKLLGPDAMLRDGLYNEDWDGFRVTQKIFDAFVEAAENEKTSPIIIIFPNRQDLNLFREEGTRIYQHLLTHFESRGYRYIDIMDVLAAPERRNEIQDFFGPTGHYSWLANALISSHINEYISLNEVELLESVK